MKGQFKATLDDKSRITLPAKLRDALGNSFTVAKAIAVPCITIYTEDNWKDLTERIKGMPFVKAAQMRRFLSAFDIEPDKQGRFVIPPPFRDYAEIDSELVVAGFDGYAEIWSKANYDNSEIGTDELIKIAEEYL